MTIAWNTLAKASSPASLGWTVWNIMRLRADWTKAGIHAFWVARQEPPGSNDIEDPPLSAVQTGIDFLTANGFATFDGTTVTPLHVGSDSKPARLRRVPGHADRLELLPPGATPQSI